MRAALPYRAKTSREHTWGFALRASRQAFTSRAFSPAIPENLPSRSPFPRPKIARARSAPAVLANSTMHTTAGLRSQPRELTRRHFLQLSSAGTAAAAMLPAVIGADLPRTASSESDDPALARAIGNLEPYFTPAKTFRDVSRGKPLPHTLPDDKKRKAGMTRDSWKLEVISDP